MAQLANLIPDPTTDGVFSCRPGAQQVTNFNSLNHPGFVSGLLVVGDIAYGTIATADNAGFDRPFAYNIQTKTFLLVSGILPSNVPRSPPTTGDWTPPILAQVAGRVIVTHPGFDGTINKIGWFDVSNSTTSQTVDTVSGSPFLLGFPSVIGVQPGQTVTGPGIPNGTVVVATFPLSQSAALFTGDSHASPVIDNVSSGAEFFVGKTVTGPGVQAGSMVIDFSNTSLTLNQPTTTAQAAATFKIFGNVGTTTSPAYSGTFTSGNADIASVGVITDLAVGQLLTGAAIAPNTYVKAISGMTVTMTQPAIASGTHTFSATGNVIQISNPATLTANAVAVTIAGGTPTTPLWGAGDTDINPLAAQPVGVAQMSGRAYYALGLLGIQFSDSGFPCRISNSLAVQALTTNDGLPVTAIGALQLTAPLTGGIVQALIAFEGAVKMQQITGDQAFGNLSMNAVQGDATGTNAPLTICSTKDGLAFISPQGMRVVGLNGVVSNPVGERGRGICVPFIQALYPSRMCMTANVDYLRVTVQRADLENNPTVEYWYRISRDSWSGPHNFPASLIQPWRSTFVLTPFSVTPPATLAQLFQSDAYPNISSIFTELGQTMNWTYQPTPLPDNGAVAMNCVVEMLLACAQSLPPLVTLGDTTAGSKVLTNLLSEVGMDVGQAVLGPGIPNGATVVSFGGTSVTISLNATVTASQVGLAFGQPIQAIASDISGTFLDVTGAGTANPTIWGGFNWGEAIWGGSSQAETIWGAFIWGHALWGGQTIYKQVDVPFHEPLVFKQLVIAFTGLSNYDTKIGNLYFHDQILPYRLQA